MKKTIITSILFTNILFAGTGSFIQTLNTIEKENNIIKEYLFSKDSEVVLKQDLNKINVKLDYFDNIQRKEKKKVDVLIKMLNSKKISDLMNKIGEEYNFDVEKEIKKVNKKIVENKNEINKNKINIKTKYDFINKDIKKINMDIKNIKAYSKKTYNISNKNKLVNNYNKNRIKDIENTIKAILNNNVRTNINIPESVILKFITNVSKLEDKIKYNNKNQERIINVNIEKLKKILNKKQNEDINKLKKIQMKESMKINNIIKEENKEKIKEIAKEYEDEIAILVLKEIKKFNNLFEDNLKIVDRKLISLNMKLKRNNKIVKEIKENKKEIEYLKKEILKIKSSTFENNNKNMKRIGIILEKNNKSIKKMKEEQKKYQKAIEKIIKDNKLYKLKLSQKTQEINDIKKESAKEKYKIEKELLLTKKMYLQEKLKSIKVQ